MSGVVRLDAQSVNILYTDTGHPVFRSASQSLNVMLTSASSKLRSNTANINVLYVPFYYSNVPISDISNSGGWSSTPIYDIIDEEDGNSVYSQVSPVNGTFETLLDPIDGFDANGDYLLCFRYGKVDTGLVPADTGDSIDLTIQLYQDSSTLIKTVTNSNIASRNARIRERLSSAEKALITNVSGLSVVVTANTTSTGAPGYERLASLEYVDLKQNSSGEPPAQIAGPTENMRGALNVAEVLYQGSERKARSALNSSEVLYNTLNNGVVVTQNALQVVFLKSWNSFLPTGDISNSGNWSPTPVYDVINADDSNCVTSELTPSGSTFVVALDNHSGWDKNKDLQARYNFHKVDSGNVPASDGDTITVDVRLLENTTEIGAWTHTDVQGANFTYTQEIDAAGKNKIANPDKLSMEVTANTTVVAGTGLERKIAFCFFTSEMADFTDSGAPPEIPNTGVATSGEDVAKSIVSGEQTNVGGAVVNYQNVTIEEGLGWKRFDPYFIIDGSVSGLNSKLSSRFNNDRYYKGDTE